MIYGSNSRLDFMWQEKFGEQYNDAMLGGETPPRKEVEWVTAFDKSGKEVTILVPASSGVGTPWMFVAMGEENQSEIRGKENNPIIIEYHSTTTLKAQNDETAWCSSFVNWTFRQVNISGTNSVAANSWLNWGTPLNSFQYGAVAIIQNITTDSYHVGFSVDETSSYVRILGGNQGRPGSVNYSNFYFNSYNVTYVYPPGY